MALGSATGLLIVCYLALGLSFFLPCCTVSAEGFKDADGPGVLLALGSMYLSFVLSGVLICIYAVVALLREDWSWTRRGTWAVSFWALGPVSMPLYFMRHIRLPTVR